MPDLKLLWGDFHTHLTDFDRGDEILADARENIDFCAVLCYPFVWEVKKGLRVESVRNRPEFADWWERLRDLCRRHHAPGEFVTFLGYEWHGDRTRYGDHNVIYFDEDNPLDDAWTLEELYANLRRTRAFAIPHHTGYFPGRRGKDWSVWDERLSPVMEICSIHGSSEGPLAPVDMVSNASMGPRASGGTFQDALARGHRIGVIASNDYVGLQGRWGIGRAAVWAEDCTREAIWEAILARRTYGVTGDRIELRFRINGQPMGSVLQASGAIDAEVEAIGSHAIDRIELLHSNRVVATYTHPKTRLPLPPGEGCGEGEIARDPDAGRREDVGSAGASPSHATGETRARRYKLRIEAGWGPADRYGFEAKDIPWDMRLDVAGGKVVSVERCFNRFGQRIVSQDGGHVAWHLLTRGRRSQSPGGMTQSIVVEIEGTPDTRLRLTVDDVTTDGLPRELTVADLLAGHCLIPLVEESERRVLDTFGITAEEMINPDPIFHNARKVKLHQAIPEAAYTASATFEGIELLPGRNALYVRVSQLNGQLAWSSPIWVDAPE